MTRRRQMLENLGFYSWGDWAALALVLALAAVLAVSCSAWFYGWAW
jgi:hypothetical protein